MTMTDLGVECVVGLCMAAAIWWVARRRCRSHTEEPKTRLDSADPAKAVALADDAAAAAAAQDALLAEGDSTSEADDDDSSVHSLDEQPHQHQHQQEDSPLNKEEDEEESDDDDDDDDEAAETDVTDGGDEVIEDEDEDDDKEDRPLIDEKMMEETMARAMAMAANMGVNMSESFMAMEEFLVLDTPQPAAAVVEEERMRMEDPASFVHLDDASIDNSEDEGEEEGEEEDEENEEMEMKMEKREKEDVGGEEGQCEPSSQGLMSAFWAKCEYKDECNLCHSPFSFLVRRHHCRKCCASVCSGCSSNSAALEDFGGSVERVCDRCWASVQMAAADDRRPEEDRDADDDDADKDDDEAEKALSS